MIGAAISASGAGQNAVSVPEAVTLNPVVAIRPEEITNQACIIFEPATTALARSLPEAVVPSGLQIAASVQQLATDIALEGPVQEAVLRAMANRNIFDANNQINMDEVLRITDEIRIEADGAAGDGGDARTTAETDPGLSTMTKVIIAGAVLIVVATAIVVFFPEAAPAVARGFSAAWHWTIHSFAVATHAGAGAGAGASASASAGVGAGAGAARAAAAVGVAATTAAAASTEPPAREKSGLCVIL